MIFAGFAAKWAARKVIMGTIFRSWVTYVSIAIFAAFVALWLHDRWLYDKIHNTEDGYITKIAQVDLRVSHCEANNQGLLKEIVAQNDAVASLKAKGDQLQLTADEQLRVIEEMRRQNDIFMNELDAEIVGKTCDEAMAWMLKKAIEGGQ